MLVQRHCNSDRCGQDMKMEMEMENENENENENGNLNSNVFLIYEHDKWKNVNPI